MGVVFGYGIVCGANWDETIGYFTSVNVPNASGDNARRSPNILLLSI
ncbi:MAG: hypothetical protein VKJ86_05265 [Synechococcus sp.]|nr:hypothetical protein [Synechococcus sp.]